MKTVILTVLLLAGCSCVFADVVTLKDGRKVEGKVVSENDQYVTVEFGAGGDSSIISNYLRSDIVSIEKAMPQTDEVVGTENELSAPYGTPQGDVETLDEDIESGAIKEGMTKKEVLAVVGAPENIRKSDKGGVYYEKWLFSSKLKKTNLIFENGTLKSWEEPSSDD